MKTILTALLAMLWLCVAAVGQEKPNIQIEMVVTAYSNVWLPDEDGDKTAIIFLRNLQPTSPFILDDHFLTDTPQNPQKWQFPKGTRIEPNGELLLFASGKDRRPADGSGELHTNFLYPCSVPNLILSEPIEGQQLGQYRDLNDYCIDCPGTMVITGQTLARFVVPDDDRNENRWFTETFDPAKEGWPRGGPCFGYEVVGQPEDECLVLYSTMDASDIDLPKQTLLDVSGSAFIHNGTYEGMGAGEIAGGQINESIVVPNQEVKGYPWYAPHPELEPGTGEFSASIWVNPTGENELEAIASYAADFFEFFGWWIMLDRGALKVRVGGSVPGGQSFATEVVGDRPKLNEWTHVFFRVDRVSSLLTLFINGEKIDQAQLPPGVDLSYGDSRLWLGTAQLGSQKTADYSGRLDDFALWKCALSDEEVSTLYKAGSVGESFNAGQPNGGGLADAEIYRECIGTDVEDLMYGINSSLWAVYPVAINDPGRVLSMRLFLKYDDGYVVFLNGQEVARKNYSGPSPPKFDAKADKDRPDPAALVPEFINLTAFRHLLTPGNGNRLAIAGLNADASDSRFLLCPKLCLELGETPPQDCKVTTEGQEFWVAFPGNAPTDPSNPLELSLCVRGPGETTVAWGTVEDGLVEAKPIVGGVATFKIPPQYSIDEEETPRSAGIFVFATRPVAVYAETRIDYSTDAYTVLPTGLLGDDYRVLGYKNVWSDDAGEILNGTQFVVCAAFDGTVVSIEPTAKTTGNPTGGNVTINLERGETYLMRSMDEGGGDLSGTRIRSNRPVAVYGGHRCANIPDENVFFCDTLVEQMLPTKYWGTSYTTAPLLTRTGGDVIRVMAADNGLSFPTDVFRNGALVASLEAGEVYETVELAPALWSSEFPISVAQYSQSSDADGVTKSDPFMALVQPNSSWLSRYPICSPPSDGFELNVVNIIAPTALLGIPSQSGGPTPIRIDGVPIQYSAFTDIPGTGYSYAQRPVGAGPHLVDSAGFQTPFPFGLLVYGFSTYDSYGYPGGMCFLDREPPQIFGCQEELVVYANPPEDQGVATTWEVPNFGNDMIRYFDPGSGTFGAQYSQSIEVGNQAAAG